MLRALPRHGGLRSLGVDRWNMLPQGRQGCCRWELLSTRYNDFDIISSYVTVHSINKVEIVQLSRRASLRWDRAAGRRLVCRRAVSFSFSICEPSFLRSLSLPPTTPQNNNNSNTIRRRHRVPYRVPMLRFSIFLALIGALPAVVVSKMGLQAVSRAGRSADVVFSRVTTSTPSPTWVRVFWHGMWVGGGGGWAAMYE